MGLLTFLLCETAVTEANSSWQDQYKPKRPDMSNVQDTEQQLVV